MTVRRQFDGVVLKALSKRPEDRFDSAADFAHAVREAAAGRGLPDDEPTVMAPRPQVPSSRHPVIGGPRDRPSADPRTGSDAPPTTSRRWRVAAVALALASLIGDLLSINIPSQTPATTPQPVAVTAATTAQAFETPAPGQTSRAGIRAASAASGAAAIRYRRRSVVVATQVVGPGLRRDDDR